MTDKPKTTPEAVERLRKYVDHPYTSPDTLVVDSQLVRINAAHLARVVQHVDTLSARVAELEAAAKTSRNDALREGFKAGAMAVHREWLESDVFKEPRGDPEFSEAATDYANALIGDTNG